ncbi:response regulator [candidate division KSB1 bacterium]|nr:response regulator [candidate division KSB1 bacterium]
MRVLIAEDDEVSRRILEYWLKKWGYEVIIAHNGRQAWEVLNNRDAPRMAILDWMMPEMDGLEVCRLVREKWENEYIYIIILTAKDTKPDIIKALDAGADDYINKPYYQGELQSRIKAGRRIIELEKELSGKIKSLEEALLHVKQLQGLLPICSYCKKVRDDNNYWHQVEEYISEHSDAKFSHGICPDCYEKYAKADLENFKRSSEKKAGK